MKSGEINFSVRGKIERDHNAKARLEDNVTQAFVARQQVSGVGLTKKCFRAAGRKQLCAGRAAANDPHQL